MDLERRELLNSQGYWEIPEGLDTTNFDFTWRPFKYDRPYIHQFGTQWQKTGGPKFIVPENEGIKYQTSQHAIKLSNEENRSWRPLIANASIDFSWHPDETEPPYIYVFGNQWHDAETMPTYQYRVSGATEKKYVNGVKAELLPNKENWQIPDDIDDSNFDYSWKPNPHEPPFIWQFGTQWQKTGGPKYIVSNATSIKYCSDQTVKHTPNVRNYKIIEPIDTDAFDFSWHPDSTEEPYNYVFGSDIYGHEIMPTVVYKSKGAVGVKVIDNVKPKLKIDEIKITDSVFDALIEARIDYRYTFFGNEKIDHRNLLKSDKPDVMHIIDNVAAVIPKEAKKYLYDKLHDYPYIKYHKLGYENKPLDIIFLSNGEKGAEENYEHLLNVVKGLPNNVVGLKNIKGRVASQHEAARNSSTPWYFLINGKCKVNPDFDFSWQPDLMCTRRHYIFRATNSVNGLEYGHMAIVANNKLLTLNTTGKGLDFTLDSPHEVVNINSGIGVFNTSEWDTWRTAFREVTKLKHNVETINDKASKERLDVWLTVGNGDYAEWSIKGSKDAVEYYHSVNGNFDKLKYSYDWEWLRDKFNSIRP